MVVIGLIIFSSNSLLAQSTKKDIELGEKGFKLAVNTKGLYNDSAMTAYLNKVGQKLVSQLDSALFEFKFFIVVDKSPNAFALPGGYVFITTGLIPIIENEDELACIIGHEIIHSNNRHTIRQIRKRIIPVVLTLPIDILGAFAPGVNAATAPIKASQSLLFASYSRKFEYEVDDQGIVLAAKAGYDPMALPDVLNRMVSFFENITGEKEKKNYFSDHPFTPDRGKNITELAKSIKISKSNKISQNFLKEFEGVIYGDSPAKGIIINNTFLHPDIDFYVEYPDNWTIKNSDTAVTAFSPQHDAALAISLDNANKTAEAMGKTYVKGLSKKYKKILKKSEPFKVNEAEGYLVSFQEVMFSDTTFAYVLWLPNGDNLFKITAMSNTEERKNLLKIAKSLRPLTDEEKASIKQNYIKIVVAKKGESFEELSKRNDSKIKSDLVAIINAHQKDDKLKDGELVKIVSEREYIVK